MPKLKNEKTIVKNGKVTSKAVFTSNIRIRKQMPPQETVTESNVSKNKQTNSRAVGKTLKRKSLVNTVATESGCKAVYKAKQHEKPAGTRDYVVKIKPRDLETGIMARARKKVKNHYNKRSSLYRLLFVMVNVFVIVGILIYQRNTFGVLSLKELFERENNYIFLLYAFLAFAFIMFLESLRTYILVLKASGKNRPLLSYKSAVTHRYYDNIMPLSVITGGKTFEVFYLHNRGIKASAATSVPLAKYIFSIFATIIVSSIVIIFKWSVLQESSNAILFLGILMLVLNLLLVLVMIAFSVDSRIGPRVVVFVLKLLQRLRLIKNYRDHFYKFMRFVLEYQKSIKYYVKSPFILILSLTCTLLINVVNALIPFLIYCIFATPSADIMLEIMFNYYMVVIATNFVPLPGGAGVAEITFSVIFSAFFADGILFWAMLIWRFFSYYIYLVQGLAVVVLDFVKASKKTSLNKKEKVAIKMQQE